MKGETVGKGLGERGWGRRGVLRGERGGGVKSGVGRVVGYTRGKQIRWKKNGWELEDGERKREKKGGGSFFGGMT